MRIGMFGTFDVENYGDLLFPLIAERELKQRIKDVKIIRYSYNEKKESSWYYDVRSLADFEIGTATIHDFDCILIGGGHLIRFDKEVAIQYGPSIPQIPHPTGYWLTPALAGISSGLPVIWNAPSSSDDLPAWSHGILSFVLSNSAYVSVRDKSSADALRKAGYDGACSIIPDSAFGLARLFPPERLRNQVDNLLSSVRLRKKYIVIQATPNVEQVTTALLSNIDFLSSFDILALPISPILGDDISHIHRFLPQAKVLPVWPSPEEIAGIIAYSSGVISISLHLSITALAYGLPVLRPTSAKGGKFTPLQSSENVHYGSRDNLDGIFAFAEAVQSNNHLLCSLAKESQSQIQKHWDKIAEICRKPQQIRSSLSKIFIQANLFLSRQEIIGQQVADQYAQVQALTKQVVDKGQAVQALSAQVVEKEQSVQALTAQVAQKEQSVQALTAQVAEIKTSKAWKIALLFRRLRFLLATPSIHRRNKKVKEDLALIRSSGLFDEQWYLANNPDVAQAKVDPTLHYLWYGGFEARDPGPNFSSSWYLEAYEDVKKAGINPVVHYLKHGKEEGRPYKIGNARVITPNQSTDDVWLDENTLELISDLIGSVTINTGEIIDEECGSRYFPK